MKNHTDERKPTVNLLYHFFYPDDVVSAVQFSQLAVELQRRGWAVTAVTSNRYCRHPSRRIKAKRENWNGIDIVRLWRPGWNQGNRYLRMLNSLWMQMRWMKALQELPAADVTVLGSDPQLSQLAVPMLRSLGRQKVLAYWCHDLYPEAILADGARGLTKTVFTAVQTAVRRLYRDLDLMVDIGPCMRRRLAPWQPAGAQATLTPWALVEPQDAGRPDPATRRELFGPAALGLLYSGNMGRAHDFDLFLELARTLRQRSDRISFCFACGGSRQAELRAAVRPEDTNVRFAPFAPMGELARRLQAADVHLLSLRDGWEGVVVPSKFFGALAAGRPVLYAGPESSSVAMWIREHGTGFVMHRDNLDAIAAELLRCVDSRERLTAMNEKAFTAYHTFFSKGIVTDRWDAVLRQLVAEAPDGGRSGGGPPGPAASDRHAGWDRERPRYELRESSSWLHRSRARTAVSTT